MILLSCRRQVAHTVNIRSTSCEPRLLCLCAKVGFTPQNGLTDNLLCCIVCRFDVDVIYKCPKVCSVFENTRTLAAQGSLIGRTFFEKPFDIVLMRNHPTFEGLPL